LTHGGRRSAPYAFTEQGVAMLSSVLNSPQAIAVNIEFMRAFVRLREVLAGNKEMAAKLNELERNRFTLRGQKKVDTQWKLLCLGHNIEKLAHLGFGQ
jgi:hypothetical protein